MTKGYVVRGKHRRGWSVFAYHAAAFCRTSETDTQPHAFPTLDTAAGARAHMIRFGCTDVSLFRVYDDGCEEKIPGLFT